MGASATFFKRKVHEIPKWVFTTGAIRRGETSHVFGILKRQTNFFYAGGVPNKTFVSTIAIQHWPFNRFMQGEKKVKQNFVFSKPELSPLQKRRLAWLKRGPFYAPISIFALPHILQRELAGKRNWKNINNRGWLLSRFFWGGSDAPARCSRCGCSLVGTVGLPSDIHRWSSVWILFTLS